MDNEKAIRAAKLTLGGILEKRRAKTAVERAQGQIAPSKYLPDVPRQVHASGGYVPSASLPIPRLAVAAPLAVGQQPGFLDVLGTLNKVAGSARTISDLVRPEKEEPAREPQASRAEAKAEGLTPEASAAMEALRKGWAGSDFGIVSGYRDPEHNERVGGAKDSQHIHGNAYDVDTTGWSPEDKLALADAAWNAGFRGFGFYDNNMHFDVADPRAWGPSHSRDSIPDWAQGWAQERYGYAEGGKVAARGKFLAGNHPEVPDVVYHGTKGDFRSFMPLSHFGTREAANQRLEMTDPGSKNVIPVHLSMKKPLDLGVEAHPDIRGENWLDDADMLWQVYHTMKARGHHREADQIEQAASTAMDDDGLTDETRKMAVDAIRAAGYDGLMYTNKVEDRGSRSFVALGPEQVKSALSAKTFDPKNPDMTFADGGEVTDLGQVREQKQLQTYHTGMMDDIHQRMSNAMEAHEKAVGQGVFDGYEVGDTLQGSAHPMRITGRYMQKWKPTTMALRSFERMGTEPTIIEHEGEQYIPMLRYETGKEGVDGFQAGSAYLDGVKAAGYQKMGGLRAVKARGGAVEFMRDNHPLVPDELYHGNALKVVENQKYHGNGNWSSELDQEATDRNIAAQDFREFKPSSHGNYGPGIYLTDKPEVASDFAQGIRADQKEPRPHGQVMKLHASIKQPFHDGILKDPAWKDYIKSALTQYSIPHGEDRNARDAILKALDNGTATVRDLFLRDTPQGTLVNQHGQHDIHDTIRRSGFDGIIAHRPDGSKEYVAFKPEQVKSALSARKFDPTSPDMTYADGGAVPQKTVKAYKLFRTKGDGKLYPLFVNADKPVPMGEWLEAEEGPQGKAEGRVKSKIGDLAYRPGWHAGDLPMATHIGGKSDPSLKKPDYRPDNHVWAEVEMAADKDWQSVADSRGKGVKAHITDQVPYGGFYRYKTNPNMTGNWLIGGNMKVNRVLPDEEVKAINDQAGTADLPRRSEGFAAGGAAMFEGMHEDLQDEQGKPMELWHGTPSEGFNEFDNSKVGSERDAGFYGRGHYLTPDYDTAEEYASHSETGEVGKVMGPLHAALKNPFVWDMSDENKAYRTKKDLETMGIKRDGRLNPWDNLMSHEIDTFMKHMNQRGHDGVIVKQPNWQDGEGSRVTEVVVFKPTAIKHKDAERFDPNDPNIYHARGGVAK